MTGIGGAEEEESKPIHGMDLGSWLQKKLEKLRAPLDELDHAYREARDFTSHFLNFPGLRLHLYMNDTFDPLTGGCSEGLGVF